MKMGLKYQRRGESLRSEDFLVSNLIESGYFLKFSGHFHWPCPRACVACFLRYSVCLIYWSYFLSQLHWWRCTPRPSPSSPASLKAFFLGRWILLSTLQLYPDQRPMPCWGKNSGSLRNWLKTSETKAQEWEECPTIQKAGKVRILQGPYGPW